MFRGGTAKKKLAKGYVVRRKLLTKDEARIVQHIELAQAVDADADGDSGSDNALEVASDQCQLQLEEEKRAVYEIVEEDATGADGLLTHHSLELADDDGQQPPSQLSTNEWVMLYDADSGDYYYENTKTHEWQWEPPPGFAVGEFEYGSTQGQDGQQQIQIEEKAPVVLAQESVMYQESSVGNGEHENDGNELLQEWPQEEDTFVEDPLQTIGSPGRDETD